MLREIAPSLWCTERPQRFLGIEMGTRMTVVRLREGELFVHSPVALDPATREELDARGPVRFIVAPNRFHHLYAAEFAAAYPEAELHVAPGLPEKRRDLPFTAVLGDEAAAGWAGQIDQLVFRAAPLLNEVVFHHPVSRTLLLADLSFNVGAESPALTRLVLRLFGAYGRFGPSVVERLTTLPHRRAAREELQRILAWDFDRVVVAHGRVLERGGREALRRGYRWLLGEG